MRLDAWQQEVLGTRGNMLLCSGRQTGKSFIISRKACKEALEHSAFQVLVIAPTERQSEEVLIKCLVYLDQTEPNMICKGKDRPTKHKIKLKNGSTIECLPTGATGAGIRGKTIDLLICDEAGFVEESVWSAITPMLLTTAGEIWLISTPNGKNGYFWDRYNDPNFKRFHVNSEKVMREREINSDWTEKQREGAIKWLEQERERMTDKEFRQEYCGEFVDDLSRFFSDDLINKTCTLEVPEHNPRATKYLGVNISPLGVDEANFEVLAKYTKNNIQHIGHFKEIKTTPSTIINNIINLNNNYKFMTIYLNESGIGGGVFQNLLETDGVKRKITAINRTRRSLDHEGNQKTKVNKEDLYSNMLLLLQQNKLKLLDDDEVRLSLKSIQYEYLKKDGKPDELRIFGRYPEITEALVNASWCYQDRKNTLWCR